MQLKIFRQEAFYPNCGEVRLLFYLCLQLIRWGPPTSGRAISFAQSVDLNVNLTQKCPDGNTQNDVWLHIQALHGPAKLTHHINHHRKSACGSYLYIPCQGLGMKPASLSFRFSSVKEVLWAAEELMNQWHWCPCEVLSSWHLLPDSCWCLSHPPRRNPYKCWG